MSSLENDKLPSFWEILQEIDVESVGDDLPPATMSAHQRAVWRLLKTVSDPMRGSDSACVSAAKEILERLYGKVPVVERRETAFALNDLDVTALSGEQLAMFQNLLQIMVKSKKKNA